MLIKGVVYGRLGEAYSYIVITAFSIGAIVAYLSTLALIGIVNRF